MTNDAAIVLAILAYMVTILLIVGGLFCLYVSLKMISKRAQQSGTPTNFTAEFGAYRISIGTGSLAALVLAISVVWALVALLSKPQIEFAVADDGTPLGVIKLISSVEVKPPNDVDAVTARLVARNEELTAVVADFVRANAEATNAADAAEAAAAQAAEAADAAADAAEHAAADIERQDGG